MVTLLLPPPMSLTLGVVPMYMTPMLVSRRQRCRRGFLIVGARLAARLILQIVSSVGVEAVAAGHDLTQWIVAGASVVARGARELGSPQLFGRIRRDQRFLHAPVRSAQCRVA